MKDWFRNHPATRNDPAHPFATNDDFHQLFTANMESLYRFALLLTGDPDKAEQSFVAGIDDCVSSNHVSRDRALAWAKLTIIQNAIRLLQPRSPKAESPLVAGLKANAEMPNSNGAHFNLNHVLILEPFARFVFVMSVLERYSDHECALLLGCSVEEVCEARSQALRRLYSNPGSFARGRLA